MKRERNTTIDLLRGTSMLLVILIHCLSYAVTNPVWYVIWDYIHIAVAGFVFCSAHILMGRWLAGDGSGLFAPKGLWRRFLRLYLPYLGFVGVFALVRLYFEPDSVTISWVLDAITVTGGIDINWLVLLFLQFILVFPVVVWLFLRQRAVFWLYTAVASATSILLYIFGWNLGENPWEMMKWIMWLPWSLIGVAAIAMHRLPVLKSQPWIFAVLGVIISVSLVLLQPLLGQSIFIFDNKYPPDVMFLIYGLTGTLILYLIFSMRSVQQTPLLSPLLQFYSTHSYQLYFIHYILLYAADKVRLAQGVNPLLLFLVIALLSGGVQWLLLRAKALI